MTPLAVLHTHYLYNVACSHWFICNSFLNLVHDMASLDAELHKNLLFLKTYEVVPLGRRDNHHTITLILFTIVFDACFRM